MEKKNSNKIVAFDFFCGCGGTSSGFQSAGLEIAFALDIDPDAKNTFVKNFPKTIFCHKSITKLTGCDLQPILNKYRNSYKLFCGCAPCQPFTKQNTKSPKRDTRKSLLSQFGIIIDKNREKIVTTIELEFNKSVMDVAPIHVFEPLTYKATLTASQNQKDIKNVVDGDAKTTWLSDSKSGEIWIEASFDKPVTVASMVAGRGDHWDPKNKPELQFLDKNGAWTTVLKWKPKWETVKFLKTPVTASKFRLLVKGTRRYNLAAFELYAPL